MDVDVDLVEQPRLQPQPAGVGPRVGQRRLGRLLHHVAQRTGQGNAARALAQTHLDGQRVAAVAIDGQPGHQANLVLLFHHAVAELARPHDLFHVGLAHRERPALARGDLDRQLAHDLAQVALQLAHARFQRVVADERPQGLVFDRHLDVGDAVGRLLLL